MRTNSGLRFTAKSIATFVAAALVLTLSACATTTAYPKTAAFLQSKFTATGVEGFTPGQIDFGFTLEAATQVLASGAEQSANVKTTEQTLWAQSANLTDGYLIDSVSKALKPGLAGKALVFGKVYSKTADATFSSLKTALENAVSTNGELAQSNGNAFDYGWAILGLTAATSDKANLLAVKLASLLRADGGFGSDLSASTTSSSADATGIALMAFAATKGKGDSTQEAAKDAAAAKALAWLAKNTVEANHFEAWGDIDVNGTEYAAMGMSASGVDVKVYREWLAERIGTTGGLETPWSKGAGDTFATIQGLLILDGRSYTELVK